MEGRNFLGAEVPAREMGVVDLAEALDLIRPAAEVRNQLDRAGGFVSKRILRQMRILLVPGWFRIDTADRPCSASFE
jgi:hypothetical protein